MLDRPGWKTYSGLLVLKCRTIQRRNVRVHSGMLIYSTLTVKSVAEFLGFGQRTSEHGLPKHASSIGH